MKNLIVAESAGFCFGVGRAVKMAEQSLKEGKCYCLGDIIHNRDVVEKLSAEGLIVIDEPEDLPDGQSVIIRSHGAPKRAYDALELKNANIIDATCPKVTQIHKIVSAASEAKREVIVIGAQNHPEVQAICGWCDRAIVLQDLEALTKWADFSPENRQKMLTAVFQTTQTKKILDECMNFFKKECTNCEAFDTICNVTSLRQKEAMELAEKMTAMVVIGGKHSANSVHLAQLCSGLCANTQFVENATELDLCLIKDADTVGITAGASTPSWIIKEVKHKMTDEIKIEEMTTADVVTEVEEVEMTFDEMLESSLKSIYNGDTVTGVVVAVTPTEVSVDLSTKHSGFIPFSEYTDDASVKLTEIIKVGDTIEATVVRVNDVEGTAMLSKKRLDAVKHWNDIEIARDEGTVVEGIVTEENKGGVVVSVNGIRVFVPASQTGLGREVPMTELLKTTARLRITEVNRSRRRVVGSIRAVASKERKEKADLIWNEIDVNKAYAGTVKSLTSYGAFVDIGGVDGMVHVSELSWNRIGKPADVVSVGDAIDVYVLSFDKESHKISLGHKNLSENPWETFTGKYSEGDVANVKIVKLMAFGAFAEVMPGVDGLIHISQIADRRIGKPSDVLTVGETVDAKITAIDGDNKRISLSIRALSEPEVVEAPVEEVEEVVYKPRAASQDALVYEVSATGEVTGNEPDMD